MPLYDCRCEKCGLIQEVYRSIANREDLPECCGQKTARHFANGFYAQNDIEPYMTVAADKESKKRVFIQSRKQHREFLHRNNYIEAGNEKTPFYRGKGD